MLAYKNRHFQKHSSDLASHHIYRYLRCFAPNTQSDQKNKATDRLIGGQTHKLVAQLI